MAKQTITVYINDSYQYFVGEHRVSELQLQNILDQALVGLLDGSVVLKSDKNVPVQYVVNVIDAVNKVNDLTKNRHKVILATKPRD